MLITATNSDKTVLELVTPASGTQVGEIIQISGFPSHPVELLNDNTIQNIKNDLKTSSNCVATYKGSPLTTSVGPCTVRSLKEAQLG